MKVGIIAGEASGDYLGAYLMGAMQQQFSNSIDFEGIGGDSMCSKGLKSIDSFELIQYNGLSSVAEIYRIYKKLLNHWKNNPPDIFIGIDYNLFNFKLESKLSQYNIPICHCVGPSIYVRRPNRKYKISKYIDLLLLLYDFEKKFYRDVSEMETLFVGHPMMATIDMPLERSIAKPITEQLTIGFCLGSRIREVEGLYPIALQTMKEFYQKYGNRYQINYLFLVPNEFLKDKQTTLLNDVDFFKDKSDLSIEVKLKSSLLIRSVDVFVACSGTLLLELALYGKPFIPIYKAHWLSRIIFFRELRAARKQTSFCTLPEFILQKGFLNVSMIVDNLDSESLFVEIEKLIHNDAYRQTLLDNFFEVQRKCKVLPEASVIANRIINLMDKHESKNK